MATKPDEMVNHLDPRDIMRQTKNVNLYLCMEL